MKDLDRINRFLQDKLQKINSVGAVEAGRWLDEAGILQDSVHRPGRELRRLLRKNLILGQEQLPNGRWIIRQISLEVATSYSLDSSLESDQIEKGEVEDDSCAIVSSILNRNKIASREEAIRPNSPIPRGNGVYAWYFRNLSNVVPVDGCAQLDDYFLLYVGISPRNRDSTGDLRKRIHTHFGKNLSDNASRSTLRLSLGCLLSEKLDITLQHVDCRIHFNDGEKVLSEWMSQNAKVTWHTFRRPWEIEKEVIEQLSPPFNLNHNTQHQFYDDLHNLRTRKKNEAK